MRLLDAAERIGGFINQFVERRTPSSALVMYIGQVRDGGSPDEASGAPRVNTIVDLKRELRDFGLVGRGVLHAAQPDVAPVGEFAARAATEGNAGASAVGVFEEGGVVQFPHFAGAVDDDLLDAAMHLALLARHAAHCGSEVQAAVVSAGV